MTELPFTPENVKLVQEYVDETKRRVVKGGSILFTAKASRELEDLFLDFDITEVDIQSTLMNLTVEDYYRGVDPSPRSDFNVCAFCAETGKSDIQIYLKYGLHVKGTQILLFSNHIPTYSMSQPFKK